jgi:hypothetical protein
VLIGAGTPKEAIARGSVVLIVVSIDDCSLIATLMPIEALEDAFLTAIATPLDPS